jgi:hypothetical protein
VLRLIVVALLLFVMFVPGVAMAVPVECEGYLLVGDVLGWAVCRALSWAIQQADVDHWLAWGNPGY